MARPSASSLMIWIRRTFPMLGMVVFVQFCCAAVLLLRQSRLDPPPPPTPPAPHSLLVLQPGPVVNSHQSGPMLG